MIASILLAAGLAVLAPFHMIGPWNDGSSDPWQRLAPEISKSTVEDDAGIECAVDPSTLVMLEETSTGGFTFAADTVDGGIFLGVSDAGGTRLYTADGPGTNRAHVAGGIGLDEGMIFYSLLVWRTDSPDQPFGHAFHEFATEQELETYMSAHGLD